MQIVLPAAVVEPLDGITLLKKIERVGRISHRSEDRITEESYLPFVRKWAIESAHETLLEHGSISVRIRCDRGVSHEIVRHRLSSIIQESTRYVRYDSGEVKVIEPPLQTEKAQRLWKTAWEYAEGDYIDLLAMGEPPEIARSVLPTSLATSLALTANLREWRLILKLRTAKAAHPQMRQIMVPLLRHFQSKIPVIFDDIAPAEYPEPGAVVTEGEV